MYKQLLTMGLILTGIQPVQAAELEELFKGFNQGCQMTNNFSSFHLSLIKNNKNPKNNDYYLPGNPRLPQGIRGSLGQVKLTVNNQDNYTMAKLPLKGKFYGLPVVEYQGLYGNANGINSMSFIINAPVNKVKNVLQKNRVNITDYVSHSGTLKAELVPKGQQTYIVCDWSS
ncbi:MAG TPA: hypothetical protein V6C58_14945 [Allocoleopsis sp.]